MATSTLLMPFVWKQCQDPAGEMSTACPLNPSPFNNAAFTDKQTMATDNKWQQLTNDKQQPFLSGGKWSFSDSSRAAADDPKKRAASAPEESLVPSATSLGFGSVFKWVQIQFGDWSQQMTNFSHLPLSRTAVRTPSLCVV